MNKRQQLVQKQFLNNEEAVIKRLTQIYTKSSNDINEKIKNLTFSIGKLQMEYDWMDDSNPKKVQVKSMIQSKIYQRQYQEQLQSQVDGILKQMQTSQFVSISDYLDTCYTDGFIGTIFDAHGQGVPIMSPINQEAMVQAVQLESKISKGLYTRLGEDVNLLKKKITAQVSRSIASGMTYAQTAKALENYSKIGYNNAIRISRTEGHRVQTTATMDAMKVAKEKGANVVKQWDATLDGRTRDSHARVDGEIRDIDKKFSNGLMYPGDPNGQASEVINCRCALLQRAKWALDDEELQVLQDRANYFGLDKTDEFKDFKKTYLKAVEDSVFFTDEQSKAIEWYVSGEGQWINQYLRGRGDFGTLSEDEETLLKMLTEATDRVLPDDIKTLYRSVDASAVFGNISDDEWWSFTDALGYNDKFAIQKIQPTLERTKGKIITEKGFMSTSKDYDLVNDWGGFTGSDKPITLEFTNVPKGLKGADLKAFDVEGDEQFEVLLARNTKYQVDEIYYKNGNVHVKAHFIVK